MNHDQIGGTAKRLASACDSEGGTMIPGQARLGDLWCRLMHTEPMWPAHGQYECRTCGRRFRVGWEQSSRVTPSGLTWQPETQAQVCLAAERL